VVQFVGGLSEQGRANLAFIDVKPMHRRLAGSGEILPPDAGKAALTVAEALAKKAAAAATPRAYKTDWKHFSAWRAVRGFVPVPAAPATVGAPPR
jgi:hypothetical protein